MAVVKLKGLVDGVALRASVYDRVTMAHFVDGSGALGQ
jgi:hypothetical protein